MIYTDSKLWVHTEKRYMLNQQGFKKTSSACQISAIMFFLGLTCHYGETEHRAKCSRRPHSARVRLPSMKKAEVASFALIFVGATWVQNGQHHFESNQGMRDFGIAEPHHFYFYFPCSLSIRSKKGQADITIDPNHIFWICLLGFPDFGYSLLSPLLNRLTFLSLNICSFILLFHRLCLPKHSGQNIGCHGYFRIDITYTAAITAGHVHLYLGLLWKILWYERFLSFQHILQ